jgi:hypothetical protein
MGSGTNTSDAAEVKKWIQKAVNPKEKGALHKMMGVPPDQNIPLEDLRKAASKPGLEGQRARMALNMLGKK